MIVSEYNITKDSLFDGQLSCYQNQEGYRFSIDSVLLAHLTRVRPQWNALDLGCGNGIIGLILLYRWQHLGLSLTGIERQKSLFKLAQRNMAANHFSEKAKVICGDIRQIDQLVTPESYDLVVCNPPFYKSSHGRQNANIEAREARHQLHGSLQEFLRSSFFAVKNKGEVSVVYPAAQLQELLYAAKSCRIPAKSIDIIYSYPDDSMSARLVIVTCVKNGSGLSRVNPPFYIYEKKKGQYSEAVRSFFSSDGLQNHI